MLIRQANVADARAIARIHVRAWQVAYRGQIPDAHLDGLTVPDRAERWRHYLGQGVPAWVAVRGGATLGFVSAGADRERSDGAGEIYAIYVHPDYWGIGAGRALFAHALERLADDGYRTGVLWVLASNARARRFYDRAGWRPDGGEKLETIGGAPALELRYRGALATSPR